MRNGKIYLAPNDSFEKFLPGSQRVNIVVMKVIHQGFTQVKNAHTTINWLIKVKLCPLNVNGNEVFIKDRTTIIVWLGC